MNKITKYMICSLMTNLFLSVSKLFFGIICNVKSLIADGIHSFSDLITDVIAIIGSKLSSKPADNSHPRGHGNIEYLTSLIISIFIIIASYSMLKASFDFHVIPNVYLSIMVLLTIIIKLALSRFLVKKGKKLNNMILISSGSESYTDVFSSVVVLLAIVLSQFYDVISFLKYSDVIASIIISIMIFVMGARLLLKNLSLLIGEKERSREKTSLLRKIIKDREDNFILKEYTMHKLGSYYEVVIKILVDGDTTVRDGHILMNEIKSDLLNSKLNIKYVTIQIEPIKDN